ncbi:hypothetical protein [Streptomyces bungoensis]|nr:hypothetical protein [Streptomyces bungoensis]
MNGLHTLAPWWLPALVDLVVGGLCVALALRPAAPPCGDPPEPGR